MFDSPLQRQDENLKVLVWVQLEPPPGLDHVLVQRLQDSEAIARGIPVRAKGKAEARVQPIQSQVAARFSAPHFMVVVIFGGGPFCREIVWRMHLEYLLSVSRDAAAALY